MTYALVSGAHVLKQSTDGSNVAATTGIDTTGVNFLVMAIGASYLTTAVPHDSYSNTWTLLSYSNLITPHAFLYYCALPTVGASHTFSTISGGTSEDPALAVIGFSGSKSTPYDVKISNEDANGVTTRNLAGGFTPGEDNELIVTALCFNSTTAVASIDGGFSITDQAPNRSDGFAYGLAIAYLIQTSATAANPTWTNTAAGYMTAIMASFKAGAAATTSYYPGSDITAGNWTPSVGGSLYATIDETPPDDSDYDQSGLNPSGDTMEVKFLGVSAPGVTTGHVIHYRIKGDASTQIVVSLYCATTLIKSWTHNPAPNSWTQYDQALSSGEAATITDYSNLRLRAVAG